MFKRLTKLLLLTLLYVFSINTQSLEAKDEWLITPKDMQQIKQKGKGTSLKKPISVRGGPGPTIVLENPKMLE